MYYNKIFLNHKKIYPQHENKKIIKNTICLLSILIIKKYFI